MKKTFPVNINGTIYYIDEDAYMLLNNYLDQLRKAFPGEEGVEITSDIEARISEHFGERIREGANVIVLEDVNTVIETMGRPSELADEDCEEVPEPPTAPQTPTPPPYQAAAKRLYRDERNKVFGGVISGIGIYLGWNITVMRVLFVLLTVTTYCWPCIILYLLCWMIIPPACTPRQILEQNGQPVNLSTVGSTILGTADPGAAYGSNGATATSIFKILGNIIIGFFGLIAACVGIAGLVLFFLAACGLILFTVWGDFALLGELDLFSSTSPHPVTGAIGAVLLALAIITPCIALIWGACCALFKARGANRTTIILGVILEIAFIIGAVIFLQLANLHSYPIAFSQTVSAISAAAATSFSVLPIS